MDGLSPAALVEDEAAAEDEEDEDVERIARTRRSQRWSQVAQQAAQVEPQLSQEKGKYVTRMTEFS